MRHALPWLLALALVPSVSADETGLGTRAPLILDGTLHASADALTLFHLAFANGTLTGSLFNATLFEEHQHEVHCGLAGTPPPGTPNGFETHPVRHVAERPVRLQLDQGSLITATYASSKEQEITLPDSEEGGALLGPNPYLYVEWPNSYGQITDQEAAEAFPRSEFLLAPQGRLSLAQPVELELESGNLTLQQDNVSRIYTAHRSTTQSITCTGPLPGQTQPGSLRTTTNYRLSIRSGLLTVQQNGLHALQEYYDGSRGVESPDFPPGGPPRGYWYRNQGETLQRLYADFALPNTLIAGSHLKAQLEGVLRLSDAKGSLGKLEFRGQDAEVSGKLTILPLSQTEQGRRMQSDIGGDVFLSRVAEPGASTDYKPYMAGATAGVLISGLLVYVWPGLKFRLTQLLLLPLYARLRKEEVLENTIRDDILQVVGEQPGISASELGRRLECGWGTLVYHLTVLERMKLLSSAREGRHRRFFVQGRINYSDKGALAILANPAARIILDAVRQNPGIIQKDLGERVGLSAGTVAWHVERLASQGLILKEEDGRTVRYLPSERLLELTARMAA